MPELIQLKAPPDLANSAISLGTNRNHEKILELASQRIEKLNNAVSVAVELYNECFELKDRDPAILEKSSRILEGLRSNDIKAVATAIISSGRIEGVINKMSSNRFPAQIVASQISMALGDTNSISLDSVPQAVPLGKLERYSSEEIAENVCLSFALGVEPPAASASINMMFLYRYLTEVSLILDQCPVRFLVSAANLNGMNIYEKSRIIETIGEAGTIEVAQSDKNTVAESAFYNSTEGGFEHSSYTDTLFNFMDSGNMEFHLKNIEPYIAKRIELLKSGRIFIKPFEGACSENVISMEQKGNQLILKGDKYMLDFLQSAETALGSFEDLKAAVHEGKIKAIFLRTKNHSGNTDDLELSDFDYEPDVSVDPMQSVEIEGVPYQFKLFIENFNSYTVINPSLLQSNLGLTLEQREELAALLIEKKHFAQYKTGGASSELIFVAGEDFIPGENIYDRITFQPAVYNDFFKGCNVVRPSEDELIITLSDRSSLQGVLAGVDFAYLTKEVNSYVEKGIEIPLYQNKTWEIRVINFQGEDGPQVLASYCKVAGMNEAGEAHVVNNISKGGSGEKTTTVVSRIYQDLFPKLSAPEIEEKVKEFMVDLNNCAKLAVDAASIHFQKEAISKLRAAENFYNNLKVDTCSTDFMIEVQQTESGPKLRPVLIDFNLFYGYEGLKSCDPVQAFLLNWKLGELPIIRDLALEFP